MATKQRMSDLTPAQQLAAIKRAQALKSGELPLPPLRCGWCNSSSITQDPDEPKQVRCVNCGKPTDIAAAARARQLEVESIILEGPQGGNLRAARRSSRSR